jgi:hypothetical protein
MKKRMINSIILNVMSIRGAFKRAFAEVDKLEKRIEKLESCNEKLKNLSHVMENKNKNKENE